MLMDASLSLRVESELNKARDGLRQLDDDIRLITGRRTDDPRFGRLRSCGVDDISQRDAGELMSGGQLGQKRRITYGWESRGDGDDRKRSRLVRGEREEPAGKPVVQSSVTMPLKEVKSRDAAITEQKESEVREVSVRNKRMFGVLLGTLKKFKKDEEKQTFSEQERKRKEIETRLEETKRRERNEMEMERQKLMEKRRRQESDVRRLQRKLALVAATENQVSLMKRLQNFIQTTTKPHIFFMPAKHSIRTIELQKKSQKRLDEVIKRKEEEMEAELKEMEQDAVVWPANEEDPEEQGAPVGTTDTDATEPPKTEPKDIQEELKELSAGYAEELNFEEDEQTR